ncbi:phosphatidylinositol-specific phospholipase C1-like protein [Gordonia jinhuaensis]|uniref:Phosphoinositide phospholipase C, Ca2+-dependent n=1 Tax=Gordonia jinhuaensis TaxID=1517702 RepID=A0A916WTP4_9ACTN|nr:Ca2+-dependent phosphoinositide-specific phospholipase C [Gordonia jinhuaensis]GGB29637.1 hypothetical protein GCM10011489_17230 [Gordonia jinhuaensis]
MNSVDDRREHPEFDALPPGLRLNQTQFIATHNSCHRIPVPDERFPWLLGADLDSYRYDHLPFARQLGEQNVRGLELDLYPDPDGGRYRRPLARRWRGRGEIGDPALARPGIKVMHGPDEDYRTVRAGLVGALEDIVGWSAAHPHHVPLVIQLELKRGWPFSRLVGGVGVPSWSAPGGSASTGAHAAATALDELDDTLRAVAGDRLLVPDDLRIAGKSLRASVLEDGWPLVDDIRGRIICFLDAGDENSSHHRRTRAAYTRDRPNLEGRVAFTTPAPDQPDAAIVMRNDPRGESADHIRALVERGFVVRTRADVPVSTAKRNDHARVRCALDSGAQMISTDFPVAGRAFRWGDGTFVAQLPGGVSVRPNPVTAAVRSPT